MRYTRFLFLAALLPASNLSAELQPFVGGGCTIVNFSFKDCHQEARAQAALLDLETGVRIGLDSLGAENFFAGPYIALKFANNAGEFDLGGFVGYNFGMLQPSLRLGHSTHGTLYGGIALDFMVTQNLSLNVFTSFYPTQNRNFSQLDYFGSKNIDVARTDFGVGLRYLF